MIRPGAVPLQCWSSVVDQINEMMSQSPRAIALTDGDVEWTYEDLRRHAEAVVKSLAASGVTGGSVVGMHLPRCADAIASLLGIMFSGCVYLPLDPSYPVGRLRYMLDQSEAVAVISRDRDPDTYGESRIWLPAPTQATMETGVEVSRAQSLSPGDCAYILFTSGSTGDPKGVMVSHGNITVMSEWASKVLNLTSFDSSATSCSLSFDPSLIEILLPLSVGGTVNVIPHALALGPMTRPVSFVSTTPRVVSELLEAGQLPALKALIVGGEVLTPDVAERILASGRVGALFNCYGPTECTVGVTLAEVAAPVPDVIPIGRQVPGTEIMILDEDGRLLADGERGEICIFGDQVASGYVNSPAQTDKRFVAGPLGASDPQRYYRTGDTGWRAEDGMFFYAGRADTQVKLNGIRVELAEIDVALRAYPQVVDAATIARPDGRTVAYIVPAQPGTDVDLPDLRRHLSERLPRFMLPAGIVAVTKLPQTINGKLDTSALPEWSSGRSTEGDALEDQEVDEPTARVVQIIRDVTGFRGQIRPSDDFIDDLGGTSLGIMRVLSTLEQYSGGQIRITDALADTTVVGLVNLLRCEKAGPQVAEFSFNEEGSAPPLFMVSATFGGVLSLRRAAELLPPHQPVYGFQVYDATQSGGIGEVTVSALSDYALKRIREVQPTGPFSMTGHSAGGMIVLEAAQKVLEAGAPAPRILLMDTPRRFGTFRYYWGEVTMYWTEYAPHPAKTALAALNHLPRPFRAKVIDTLDRPQAENVISRNKKQLKAVNSAFIPHKARPYDGNIAVMRTRQGRLMAFGRKDLGWKQLTHGKLQMIDVPGDHLSMLREPHVHAVTQKLEDWLSDDSD